MRPKSGMLLVAAIATIVVLAALQMSGVDGVPVTALQLLYVAMLVGLVIYDYPTALGLAMIELAVGGAAGGWTWLPGGVSGRILTLAIVFAGGLGVLIAGWRATGRLRLGRYGWHALLVALVMPLVWVPLGLTQGNGFRAAIQDANGYAFVAFTLALVAVMTQGRGWVIRRWLLIACVANAIFTGALIVGALTSVTPLYPMLSQALVAPGGLDFGGAIGYMPSGAGRLYLASGLYLQIGLALIVWRLVSAPTWWAWGLYGLLLIDIAATYTRGFWLAAVGVVAIVIVLGARDWRRPAWIGVATLAVLVSTGAASAIIGASVPDYLLQRASSVLETRPIAPGEQTEPGQQPVIEVDPGAETDFLGQVSNQVRVVQARVLFGHIVERPLVGSGFGAIAKDYPFGSIPVYELTYLDILFKVGIVGALIFLSYPIRLLIDGLLARAGRLRMPRGLGVREASVPVACILSVLAATASNPYLLAAYGLLPIIAMVAWLDPIGSDPELA